MSDKFSAETSGALTEKQIDQIVNEVRINRVFSGGAAQSWLTSWALKRNRGGRPVNLIFTGEPGSGKSYSAIRLAVNLDPNFEVDNIVFDTESFLHLLNSGLKRGSVIIFDDAGLGLNNRNWQDDQVIIFGETAESMRYRGIMVFYTVPRLPFIDNITRQLIQMLLESTAEQGTMKMLFISPAGDRNDNKPWYRYPTYTTVENYRAVTRQYRFVRFQMPPRRIYVPYEVKKDAFLTDRYMAAEKRMRERRRKDEGDDEQGVRLHCSNCNYIFQYRKAAWDVKCPRCKAVVQIDPSLKPYVGISHAPIQYTYGMVPGSDADSGDSSEEQAGTGEQEQ